MVTTSPGYVALLLVIICAPCRAQEHSAALAGAVHGQGALLPDVTARLLAENFKQVLATSVTGSDGRFAFSGLPCGDSYTLTFSSPGWETRRLPHLQLRCDSTLHLGVVLESSVEPPRHLAPPEISDQLPWWGTQFGALQIADLPNTRNIWSLLQTQEPSTVTNRIDIAGLETGQPALFGALGASWTENQYSFNGLNVTDPYQPGVPLLDPSLDDLAQFQAVTGAKPKTQLNATLDARIARDFAMPRGVLTAYFDVFNILNANSNTLESDLSGPAFLSRVPLAVEAPRTARLGIQWTF